MRYRDYKIFRSGHCYHLYNRGINKQAIFLDNQDYWNFLKRVTLVLGQAIQRGLPSSNSSKLLRIRPLPFGAFDIVCYCLMPNHFHFVVRQNSDLTIDKLILKICTSYSIYFNKKYNRVGPLFQDSFKAKLVENDSYLKYLSCYVHRNPKNFKEYDFSSYKDYIGKRDGQICNKSFLLGFFEDSYQRYLEFINCYGEEEQANIQELLFEEQ